MTSYEIHPCKEVECSAQRGERGEVEICDAEHADFFTLYERRASGEVLALCDCPTEAVAKRIARALAEEA